MSLKTSPGRERVTEPEILAFTCNWCSYAGADLAGVSRIQYPPNVRIIRLMCSGRVNPAFILRAFEAGADGVLVSGCHAGDCHYVSGNLKAEERVKATGKILKLLGFGSERLRLEWISASEGEKFAATIKDFTDDLHSIGLSPFKNEDEDSVLRRDDSKFKAVILEAIKKTNVRYCLECGKCTSSCPIARIHEEYSPKWTVERFQLGFEDRVLSSRELWMCLACYLCRERCPSDVRYSEFIRTCRSKAAKEGVEGICAHGGVISSLSRLMSSPRIVQDRLDWLPEGAKVSKRGKILYFVGCLPYFDVIFQDIGFEGIKIAQNTIKILNKLGIKPAILSNERCCGHDLLWTGDNETFEKLANTNIAMIEEAHATKVVTACPECYRTIKLDYAETIDNLNFEVLHISEFLADSIDKGNLKFDGEIERKVTYQDPCRLGRHMGIYDPPRRIITSIPGVEMNEMDRVRESAICCGVSSWMTCGKHSKIMQVNRLREAADSGANTLITACPKCQIHFKCTTNETKAGKPNGVTLEISDLATLVAEAMNLG